jgi:alpha-beta hydrolase superfamily lysophospholipase
VVFDGPGQGRMLVEQQVPMRADWENVVGPVLDQVLARPDVDPARVTLMGWSLGGYLALRAASAEHRLAACIADPALYGIPEGFQARLRAAGVGEDVIATYPDLPADVLSFLTQVIDGDRSMRWTMKQRGYWVHGVSDLAGYLKATADFTLAGRLAQVTCPTLVLAAESDPLSGSAPQAAGELTGTPSTLVTFTAREAPVTTASGGTARASTRSPSTGSAGFSGRQRAEQRPARSGRRARGAGRGARRGSGGEAGRAGSGRAGRVDR